MNTVELPDLEVQIDYLLHIVQKLKAENTLFRKKLAAVIHENTLVKEQNQKAIQKINQILKQLKEEAS